MDLQDINGQAESCNRHLHDNPKYYDIVSCDAEDYDWERKKEVMERIVNLMKGRKKNSFDGK